MKYEIKHRYTGAVLFECEAQSQREAILKAIAADADLADANLAGANLAGADLADANLAGANLARAYLADANLADADLARAYLADANLAGADLADADLARAYLADANLADANLAGANLAGAYLADANLAGANLADANLAGANLAGADLARARNYDPNAASHAPEPAEELERLLARRARFRERNPDVPAVEHLDATILSVIDSGEGELDMSGWHSCETTHCRAGWAIHLAGKAGYDLEAKVGPERAGGMIYRASTGRKPWFFDTNEGALADLKKYASLFDGDARKEGCDG